MIVKWSKIILFMSVIVLSFWIIAYTNWASTETDAAISRLYKNWLTKHNNKTKFWSNRTIRRDEAAKFFVLFAKLIWKTSYTKGESQCKFYDTNDSRSDLKEIVKESCKLWLINWSKNKFNPKSPISNSQAIAILIRLIDWKQNEPSWNARADGYYEKADELWLLDWLSLNNRTSNISRGNLAILIYRASNLNNDTDANSDIQKTSGKTDLIINWLTLDEDEDGYWYHIFTIKNIWEKPYTFKSTDYIYCWNTTRTMSREYLTKLWTIKENESKTLKEKFLQIYLLEKWSKYKNWWNFTESCTLVISEDNDTENNKYSFDWKIYYDLTTKDDIKNLPDLTIENVNIQPQEWFWQNNRTYNIILKIKNIWNWIAYMNEAKQLEAVCSWAPYRWDEAPTLTKKIIDKTLNQNDSFDIVMSTSLYWWDFCYLYYDWLEEGSWWNNRFSFEKTTYETVTSQ